MVYLMDDDFAMHGADQNRDSSQKGSGDFRNIHGSSRVGSGFCPNSRVGSDG